MNKKQNKSNIKQKLIEGVEFVESLGIAPRELTKRNKNTSHVNCKIQHVLHNPFTFVNVYAKISKTKGALMTGFNYDEVIQLFKLEKASNIAKKLKKAITNLSRFRGDGYQNLVKRKKDLLTYQTNLTELYEKPSEEYWKLHTNQYSKNSEKKTKNLCNNYGFRPNKSC